MGYADGSWEWDEDDVPILDEERKGKLATDHNRNAKGGARVVVGHLHGLLHEVKAANATAVLRESDSMRLKEWLQSGG